MTTAPRPAADSPAEPFALAAHAGLLEEAARAVRRFDLTTAHRYPMRRDLKALPYEPVNLWHALSGERAHLFDRTAVPALYAALLSRRAGVPEDLPRLLVNGAVGARERFDALFGADVARRLVDSGVLVPRGGGLASRLRFVPVFGRLFVCDVETPLLPGMVWIGKDSMILANALRSHLGGRRFGRGLDVGCGTGIQTILLADHCESATGIDINERAVACARLNAAVNGAGNVDFRLSNLFEDVQERFDVIVSNPPYVFIPPEERGVALHAHGGEDYGVDFELAILAALDERLNDGGRAVLLCCSPVVRGTDILPDRVRARLSGKRLSFEFLPLFNNVVARHLDFHAAHGIEYTWAYIVLVEKGRDFQLTVRAPSQATRATSWAFRSLVKAQHRLGGAR
ncbi:MAG: class I SAM-dependent methyltransferase [Polyangiaceae bacterium]